VLGAYAKLRALEVVDGVLVDSELHPAGQDARWRFGSSAGPVRVHGSALYGCSLGMPKQLLYEVNGFDELCDPCGGEDSQLGQRLEWAGAPILYNRQMFTVESEELHHTQKHSLRYDALADEDRYRETLAAFGVRVRASSGRTDASHAIVDLLHGLHHTRSLGNAYDLESLAPADLPELVEQFPERYWFDGSALAELHPGALTGVTRTTPAPIGSSAATTA
jgi:hypothetical protein